jgi:hypothetical protein
MKPFVAALRDQTRRTLNNFIKRLGFLHRTSLDNELKHAPELYSANAEIQP